MNCKISCSFGEIVDKVTILRIKLKKASGDALINIQKELMIIEKENPIVNTNDSLFNQLFLINNRLWELEDLIRQKSKKKQFDEQYIKCSESIHIVNDKRYNIKRQINEKYNSNLKEEKIYGEAPFSGSDEELLEIAKNLYEQGEYIRSRQIIEPLMEKYKDSVISIDLLFSYDIICSVFGIKNPYFKKICEQMKRIEQINISELQKKYCKSMFCTSNLSMNRYKEAYPFLNCINYINAPGVNYKDMSFFSEEDNSERTLLLYDGGGLGDKIMFSRFIPILCTKYPEKKFIFITDTKIKWIFEDVFRTYKNFSVYSSKRKPKYDHHCSLLSLIGYLKYEHDTIPFSPLFENLKCPRSMVPDGEYYVFNWKGNVNNRHEKHNRSMDIKDAIPLFSRKKWVVITQNITEEEKNILDEHDITYLGDKIDKTKSFYDSIDILRNSKGLISTDTSLVHLSATLGVPTYVMLTIGHEWRWNNKAWYPDVKIFKQDVIKQWGTVIENVSKMI